jgi:hypothetical protein
LGRPLLNTPARDNVCDGACVLRSATPTASFDRFGAGDAEGTKGDPTMERHLEPTDYVGQAIRRYLRYRLEFQGVFYAQNLCISTLNPLRLGVLA